MKVGALQHSETTQTQPSSTSPRAGGLSAHIYFRGDEGRGLGLRGLRVLKRTDLHPLLLW